MSQSRRSFDRYSATLAETAANGTNPAGRSRGDTGLDEGRYGASRPNVAMEDQMATRTTIALEDDLDGGPAQETLQFRLDSTDYEIDLNAANARQFRTEMAPFIDRARKASRGQSRPSRPASARQHSAAVRAWAKEHHIDVSERGRIPASVVRQYEARNARG